ncbi:MAG: polyamine aminopropyltransferase [Aquificota bacterium]|nr:MAG: polyamine aminopropyltransferase [Aquificota bacterium]
MIWFTEHWTENVGLTVRANEVKRIKSKYQEILVLDTPEFGKMLILDGLVQTTERDEFIYHEMLVHPAMIAHPNPERVLVIGGGDGGSIREVLKYPSVQEAHLCEIDEEVIITAEKYFPTISNKLRDPKVKIFIEDGNAFLDERKDYYDVIIMDSSDPVGASEVLFSEEFYKKVKKSLRKDGIMVAQTESPFLQENYFKRAISEIRKVFRYHGVYLAYIPTYPSGMWSFTIASDYIDVVNTKKMEKVKELKTKYFCDSIYACLFSLPEFVQEIIKKS